MAGAGTAVGTGFCGPVWKLSGGGSTRVESSRLSRNHRVGQQAVCVLMGGDPGICGVQGETGSCGK